jgi:hypothetical protein
MFTHKPMKYQTKEGYQHETGVHVFAHIAHFLAFKQPGKTHLGQLFFVFMSLGLGPVQQMPTDEPYHLRVISQDVEEINDTSLETLDARVRFRQLLLLDGKILMKAPFLDLRPELLLRTKVVMYEALGYTCFLGDLTHGGVGKPSFYEDLFSRVENGVSCGGRGAVFFGLSHGAPSVDWSIGQSYFGASPARCQELFQNKID